MKSAIFTICFLCFSASPGSLHATTKGGPDTVRGFVKQFYDWYVPKAVKHGPVPAWVLALDHKGAVFSPLLARVLRDDSAAQAKSVDDIVGLDFDPFLNSQDPCPRYEVGRVSQKGQSYWVEIYSVCSGKRAAKPDVVAEVVRKNGDWQFVTFHYPGGQDLLAVLKLLQESRDRESK